MKKIILCWFCITFPCSAMTWETFWEIWQQESLTTQGVRMRASQANAARLNAIPRFGLRSTSLTLSPISAWSGYLPGDIILKGSVSSQIDLPFGGKITGTLSHSSGITLPGPDQEGGFYQEISCDFSWTQPLQFAGAYRLGESQRQSLYRGDQLNLSAGLDSIQDQLDCLGVFQQWCIVSERTAYLERQRTLIQEIEVGEEKQADLGSSRVNLEAIRQELLRLELETLTLNREYHSLFAYLQSEGLFRRIGFEEFLRIIPRIADNPGGYYKPGFERRSDEIRLALSRLGVQRVLNQGLEAKRYSSPIVEITLGYSLSSNAFSVAGTGYGDSWKGIAPELWYEPLILSVSLAWTPWDRRRRMDVLDLNWEERLVFHEYRAEQERISESRVVREHEYQHAIHRYKALLELQSRNAERLRSLEESASQGDYTYAQLYRDRIQQAEIDYEVFLSELEIWTLYRESMIDAPTKLAEKPG